MGLICTPCSGRDRGNGMIFLALGAVAFAVVMFVKSKPAQVVAPAPTPLRDEGYVWFRQRWLCKFRARFKWLFQRRTCFTTLYDGIGQKCGKCQECTGCERFLADGCSGNVVVTTRNKDSVVPADVG